MTQRQAPCEREVALIDAALAEPDERLGEAWRRWRERCPRLDGLSLVEHRLLPLVWRRVERAGRAEGDPDAGRLRGLARKAWFRNQHLLSEAAQAQQTLAGAGIDSGLAGGCGLLAGDIDRLGCRVHHEVDLLVDAACLPHAARLLSTRRPLRRHDQGRVSLWAPGLVPVRLQAWPGPARQVAQVPHGEHVLQVAHWPTLMTVQLRTMFSRAAPAELPPGCWVVDLALGPPKNLVQRPSDLVAALLDELTADGAWPLLQAHALAAFDALGESTPSVVQRAVHAPARRGDDAVLRALRAWPPELAHQAAGPMAWWVAQQGADPLRPAWRARLAWLRSRAADALRDMAADPARAWQRVARPRRGLQLARALVTGR